MLCGLATLITVPVVLSSGASSDGQEVAAVVVPETISAIELESDVDIDALFDAGADLEHVPDMDIEEAGAEVAAEAVLAAPQSLLESPTNPDAVEPEPETVEAPASTQDLTTSTTISEAPVTAAPAPTTTAPPATTTEAPSTTQAPTTAAPTTAAPEPVVEAPQSAEPAPEAAAPAQPTPEQWAALRHCEASGNYSIVSSNGLYHGAYQFYQPTWDGLASQIGRTDLVGLAPSQASAADQDALALLLWQQRGNQPWPHCGVHLPPGP